MIRYLSGHSTLFIIGFALFLRLLLLTSSLSRPDFIFQQDNYADYTQALARYTLNSPSFHQPDTRLFPGLPLLLLPLASVGLPILPAGIFISVVSSLASIYLIIYLTRKPIIGLLFAFLPPIWLRLSVKVATEPVTVFLLLLSVLLFIKKHYLYSAIIISLSALIRPISLCLFPALFLVHPRRSLTLILPLFLYPAILLVYNYLLWGPSDLLHQFFLNTNLGRAKPGFIQLLLDIPRTLDWHQYRILFISSLYLSFNFFSLIFLFLVRKFRPIYSIFFYWHLLSLIYIFSYGPNPFLEEFSRFSVIPAPAALSGLVIWATNRHHDK